MSEPRLADTILVVRSGKDFRIVIDGVEFPFAVDECEVSVHTHEFPSMMIRIAANSVSVENELRVSGSDGD